MTFKSTAGATARLGLALCFVATAANAGLFSDDEARKQVSDLRAQFEQFSTSMSVRLSSIEATVKSQGLIDLLAQMEAIKNDLAKMRGQMEVMTNDLESAQKRQRDLYVDLDTRLRKLEGGTSSTASDGTLVPGSVAPAPAMATVVVPGAANPEGNQPAPGFGPHSPVADVNAEQQSYDAAFDQFKTGNYAGAIAAFQTFVRTYPRSPLAPSAQYWIGNAQYAQHDLSAAIATQRALVRNYPDSQKVPDALLNIATSQAESGDSNAARKTWDEIISKYPQSEAADKAKKRLAGTR